MRVLLITGSFPPMKCGVGDYSHQLALALARAPGLQLAVVTSRAAAALGSLPDAEFLPIVEGWRFRDLGAIARVVRSWQPDVVHIQYPTQGYARSWMPWLLPLWLRLAAIPVVQTWHEVYPHRLIFRFLSKAVVPGGLVVVREGYEKRLARPLRWVLRNKTVRFIPNASAIPAVSLTESDRQDVRAKFAAANARMVVYFGFIFPPKGVELLFQIADPADSHVVIVGDLRETDPYQQSVRRLAESEPWSGKVTLAGFLSAQEAARVIAAADAVVLPFREGGGDWNTSIHGAQLQGTFVLTTSKHRRGYFPAENTYFAVPDDVHEMKAALTSYMGTRSARELLPKHSWESIREAHIELYRALAVARTRPRPA